jgi:DNA-binding response OmpR family regulator
VRATILVADDERSITGLAKLLLGKEGYRVETAADGQEALDQAHRLQPDLVLLDLMLPRVDGWEVCRRLRKEGDTPIIMLTARTDAVDKIVGLELGADDYVTKPFDPRELVARVRAVLRRSQAAPEPRASVYVAGVHVDPARRQVTVEGTPVAVRGKAFDLLLELARQQGRVVTREALLRRAWGYDYLGDSRTIDVHVAWLRQKLGGAAVQIQSVRGVGYMLVPLAPGDADGKGTTVEEAPGAGGTAAAAPP